MYSWNIYRISVETAASSGESPSLFLLKSEGCLCNKYRKQSLCPYSAQKWHGVFPSISFAFMSALFIRTACIMVKLPLIDAMCNGVLKLRDLASIVPPYSTNKSMRSTWPSFAATCKGVQPSEFCWLIKICANERSWFWRILRQAIISFRSVANQSYLTISLDYFFYYTVWGY